MLNLTNSFCRYLKLTYETLSCNKTHFKSYSCLNNASKECKQSVSNILLNVPLIDTGQQIRLFASKKRPIQKKPTAPNDSRKFKPMSESSQPTLNHVAYPGQFNVSEDNTDDASPNQNWLRPNQDPGATANREKKKSGFISPNFRIWEPVLKRNDSDENSFKFRVVSYNVLAQYLLECHPYLYTDCSPQNLTWRVRSTRLYDEITSLAPDILCLQEVQASHLESFYSKFDQIGYYGIFKQKTRHRHDGCAIYFKKCLFELLDHISVEFYQPDLPILNRDNIGIIVKLMPKNYHGPPIVVATTHLLYNPKRTDVRLAQIQVFLAEIDRFAYYNNGQESGYLPIILTGDLNSSPDSAVIKLLDKGIVSASPFRDSSDWTKIGVTDNCQHLSVLLNRQQGKGTDFFMTKIHNSDYGTGDKALSDDAFVERDFSEMFNTGVVGHSLNLMSVYPKYKGYQISEATTFQDFWITVDYIYFSCCSNLRLLERYRLPSATECQVLGQLPNDVYGSDHLVLAAVFELKENKASVQVCTASL